MTDPTLSVVMLVIDNPEPTERAIRSLRETADAELIIVDNGSRTSAARRLLEQAADRLIRNEENVGVPRGWNQGLAHCRGRHVAIANNDIEFVPGWYEHLSEHLEDPDVGMVAPASATGARIQVPRPDAGPVILEPFGPTPYGLLMLFRTELLRRVGGFCEAYGLASNEDKDICFTLWDRGHAIILDHRVVIPHEGGATWRKVLGEKKAKRLWKRNRKKFKKRWKHRL